MNVELLKSEINRLSGASYVAAVMKQDHIGKPARIRVRKVSCDHVNTVCLQCLPSWEYDWTFLFDNTAGGRRLKKEAGR